MLAIGIEDKRPLWEMRAGSGVWSGGQYKADPTRAPRAPLGDREKGWAGGIAEAGGEEGREAGPRKCQERKEILGESRELPFGTLHFGGDPLCHH